MFTHVDVRADLPGTEYAGAATPLPIVDYTDSATLGGPQTMTFTLPGRTRDTGRGRVPWSELLPLGTPCYAEGWTHDGHTATPRTLAHGFITDVGDSESLDGGEYARTTSVTVQSGHDLLLRNAVAWWMYYGSAEGWTQARAKLTADQMSGTLDKILGIYVNKIAFHHDTWRRGDLGLADLLGYHFTALRANAPVLLNAAIAEGPHWQIMQGFSDDLHEMFSVIRPGNVQPQGGFSHRPAPGSAALPRARDGGATWLIHRPEPFPYGNPDGSGNLSAWTALPLHDLTDVSAHPARVPLGRSTYSRSSRPVENFWLVMPRTQLINEEMSFSMGVSVQHKASIGRYGYSPKRIGTNLVLDEGLQQNMIELAQALTWRRAGQYNRLDDMGSGSFEVPLNATLQPGDRARLRAPHGDRTRVVEGYVTGREHRYSPTTGGRTRVQLARVLPAEVYRDPSWFVQGLSVVKVGSLGNVPTVKPS